MSKKIPCLVIGNPMDILRSDDQELICKCLDAAEEVVVLLDGSLSSRSAHQFPLTSEERKSLIEAFFKNCDGAQRLTLCAVDYDAYDLPGTYAHVSFMIQNHRQSKESVGDLKYVWVPKIENSRGNPKIKKRNRRNCVDPKAHENYAIINPSLTPDAEAHPDDRLDTLRHFLLAGELNPPEGPFSDTGIQVWSQTFAKSQPKTFAWLRDETNFLQMYRARASLTGYESVFATADSIIIRGTKILMGRRKFHPSKGLMCLPGGFINPDETALEAAMREDSEEIGIDIEILRAAYVGSHPYDAPDRDGRAGIIAIASLFVIEGPEPELKAGDDIEAVEWIELGSLCGADVAADHIKIIKDAGRRFAIRAIIDACLL